MAMRQAQYEMLNIANDKSDTHYQDKEIKMNNERVNIDLRTVQASSVNVRTLKLRNKIFL